MPYAADWGPYRDTHWRDEAQTAIPLNRLQALSKRLLDVPLNFTLAPARAEDHG
jgi:2-oxoglutarate dehydrogenase complex dehydrogenase (E1) component-like enzyme